MNYVNLFIYLLFILTIDIFVVTSPTSPLFW